MLTEQIEKCQNVTEMCEQMSNFCVEITQNMRDFIAKYPTKRVPADSKLYPGKMDHTK